MLFVFNVLKYLSSVFSVVELLEGTPSIGPNVATHMPHTIEK